LVGPVTDDSISPVIPVLGMNAVIPIYRLLRSCVRKLLGLFGP